MIGSKSLGIDALSSSYSFNEGMGNHSPTSKASSPVNKNSPNSALLVSKASLHNKSIFERRSPLT